MIKYKLELQFFGANDVTTTEEVTAFMPVLDKLYVQGAMTSIFEKDASIWSGKSSIQIPSIDVAGNADYSRTDGYVDGGIAVTWQDYTLQHDRGRRFNVDAVEADEFPFDLIAEALVKFEREKNTPEIDAVRFAQITAAAGTRVAKVLIDTEDALKAFDDAELKFMAEGLDMSRAVLFVSAKYYSLIKNYMTERGRLNPNQNNGVINRTVTMLDQTPIIPVPNIRFNDAVTLAAGTDGGVDGGYTQTGDQINFLLMEVDAAEAYTKRKADKVIAPEDNQTHDGWSVYYRTFHDIIVLKEQAPRIYAHIDAAL